MGVTSQRDRVAPYGTLDGSAIRELAHPAVHGNRAQSLAEATLAPGAATKLHLHERSEEIYHVTAGAGTMTLAGARFAIAAGDTIVIAPGTAHRLENPGPGALVVLCACAPAYAHADTVLLD
jgi:mannose-6-phosphate isomerase-like protein (cupin superfamily)